MQFITSYMAVNNSQFTTGEEMTRKAREMILHWDAENTIDRLEKRGFLKKRN